IIREIDEAVDVALYFIIEEKTDTGIKSLKKWFRLNEAPSHSKCREAIAQWENMINPLYSKESNLLLMKSIYGMKSKWTHPTYNVINEIMIFDFNNNGCTVNFEYKECTYQRKLYELTDFFKSSIWTAFQVFSLCFSNNLPLEKDDVELLDKYNIVFSD